MLDMITCGRRRIAWAAIVGLLVALTTARADDEDLAEGRRPPRHPDYVFDDELPHDRLEVPGVSSGMLFGRHQVGDAFLGRWRADYLNYGWEDYENYHLSTTPYMRTYDVFGNHIADGYEVFALEEYRTRSPQIGSLMQKGKYYQGWLRHLVIADDAYGSWAARLTVGDIMHATFTPLTLDMVGFNGIRFDAASTTHQKLTLLVSRISDPLLVGDHRAGTGPSRNVDDGVYLMGAHWETGLGNALTLGASYVNLRRFDSQRGVRSNTRKGLALRGAVPQRITVRFEDDSPDEATSGAVVFDVVATVTLAPPVDAPGEEERIVEARATSVELSPGVSQHARFAQVIGTFRDAAAVVTPRYVDYVFDVPADAVKVEFSAVVANDYRISMRQEHLYFTGITATSTESRTTPFSVVRRAEGDVRDMSNKRAIHFDYGMASAVEVMGLNARLGIPGLEVHGELVRSTNHYQYPTLLGRRSEFDDVAGYLTVDKEWSLISVGAEWFTIGPAFTSYSPHPGDTGRNRRLGEVFYFNDLRKNRYRGSDDSGTHTPFYALVDDNDNMAVNETPDNFLGTLLFPVEQGRDMTTGIFPGFDLDQDGSPDTNRNRNEYPDYDEPFLMYFSDPEDLCLGDDLNNNFIADAWEDDDLPNYPYYKDEKGLHLLASVDPLEGLRLTLGRYAVKQIAGPGENRSLYGKLSFDRRFSPRWRVRWDHKSKDVQDDIPNDYFRTLLMEGALLALTNPEYPPLVTYTHTYFGDRLEARDSFIHRGLARVEFEPRERWNIEGKLRYELNHQRHRELEGGLVQPRDDLNFWGAVFRTDYTWWWRSKLDVKPRLKVLYRLRERASQAQPYVEELQILPILRADLHLTKQSQLRLGVQGFPGFRDRRRDFAVESNDSKRTTWTLMWFHESAYQGYRIGTEVGMTRQMIDYDDPERGDAEYSRFFVQMISGVGTVVR